MAAVDDGGSMVAFEVHVISGEDDPAPHLAEGLLARELEQAGADTVSQVASPGAALPGAKAAGEWSGLLIKAFADGLPSLVTTLLGWLARRPADRIKVICRDGDRQVEIDCTKEDVREAQKLIRTFQASLRVPARTP